MIESRSDGTSTAAAGEGSRGATWSEARAGGRSTRFAALTRSRAEVSRGAGSGPGAGRPTDGRPARAPPSAACRPSSGRVSGRLRARGPPGGRLAPGGLVPGPTAPLRRSQSPQRRAGRWAGRWPASRGRKIGRPAIDQPQHSGASPSAGAQARAPQLMQPCSCSWPTNSATTVAWRPSKKARSSAV
jgi:hypothetical protein